MADVILLHTVLSASHMDVGIVIDDYNDQFFFFLPMLVLPFVDTRFVQCTVLMNSSVECVHSYTNADLVQCTHSGIT